MPCVDCGRAPGNGQEAQRYQGPRPKRPRPTVGSAVGALAVPLPRAQQPSQHYAANLVDRKAGDVLTRYPAYYNGVVPRFCILVVEGVWGGGLCVCGCACVCVLGGQGDPWPGA